MKSHHALITMVLLLFTPFAGADITDWSCAADGDGAIEMSAPTLDGDSTYGYWLTMSGTQNWYPAHVEGEFITDTELDPTVWIVESVENQTNLIWTDYHIDIGMNKAFSIIGVVAPPDWTWNITAPAGGKQLPNQPPGTLGWVGTVNYFAGTDIPVGGSGSFGLVVSFLGSVQFCTEQVPTGVPVPVPGAVLLGAIGLSVAGWRLKRKTE